MSWKKVPLKKLCSIEKGKIGITKAISGKYPLVVTAEERKSHNEYHFDGNAVVIPLVSSTGHGHRSLKRIHFQTGKFAVGNILAVVIPNDENVLRADYLFRFLYLNKERELVSRMRGMANVSLPLKEIGRIEIPLPPIEEQIAFVNKYNELEADSSILSSEFTRQLDLVKQLRQAFLREAMQGKLTSEWRKQHPELIEGANTATELLKKIKKEKEQLIKGGKIKKQKPLPPIKSEEVPFEIPEGWVCCRLGEASNLIFDGPFGSHLKTVDYTNTGVQVIRLENLGFMKFNHSKETFVSFEKYKSIISHEVFEGDVIIGSFLADGVRCVVLPKLETQAIAKADCFTIRLNRTLFNEKYLMYLLNSSSMYSELFNLLRGMTRLRINTTQLKSLPISLPPLSEQQQIVTKLDQLMHYCDQLEESIKVSQQQNELLLQQILREALEPKTEVENSALTKLSTKKPTGKIIQLKTRKCDPAERAILAGHIINQTNTENFGRVKFQKLLYLVEHHCHFDFDSNYIRKPAGPYAGDLIQEVESTLQRFRFYEIKQSQARNHKVNYTPLGAAPELDSIFLENFANEASMVDEFLLKFKNKDMEQCEIVATLYAVWNNRIIREQPINDNLLKEDFLNWDKQKIKYKDRLDGALEWMRNKNIIPTGWGKEIR